MKIFLSWSGVRSGHIANALREWLPNVIQAIEPFISTQDIAKGTRGNVAITQNLEQAEIGIVCLSPENLTAPWILFEAGALSKLSEAYVCTYLFELEPSEIEPPLGQFQHTKHSEFEVKALLETINGRLNERKLEPHRLASAFNLWWPKLEEKLAAIPQRPEAEMLPVGRSEDSKTDEMLQILRQLKISGETNKEVKSSESIDLTSGRDLPEMELFTTLDLIEIILTNAEQLSPSTLWYLITNHYVLVGPGGKLTKTDAAYEFMNQIRTRNSRKSQYARS